MTLLRLYALHRRGGRTVLTAWRLAWGSIQRDRDMAWPARRVRLPFVDSRSQDAAP
ncbi:hypothetical protein [Leptothrix discophora]|uniref:Uncharacterized protein n=1 Tax=Leptothrix discophora TaxID=89 RepID=A0ABT9G1N2_LEPDI|nr:hypothetical protein [Leptothrix discophora]MDP4300372.1 hypothetical protein [Leptothrix discophora]